MLPIRHYFAASDFAGARCRVRRRDGVRPGPPAERPGRVRFLRPGPVVVALVLRGGGRTRQQRALTASSARRPYSFVVHGLWPQYERGFPEYCQRPSPRLDRNIMTSMLDLMPAPGLIFNEWDKHGTCSGLGARAYFEKHPQGARGGEDPRGIPAIVGAENHRSGRSRGRLHQRSIRA